MLKCPVKKGNKISFSENTLEKKKHIKKHKKTHQKTQKTHKKTQKKTHKKTTHLRKKHIRVASPFLKTLKSNPVHELYRPCYATFIRGF